jgi:hypothetical protein
VTALPPEIAIKQVKDSIDHTIMWCTIILTFVGVIGTIAAVRTLRQVKRQADTLEDHKTKFDELAKAANNNAEAAILQVRAMQELITEMSVQSGILQESVKVARDSAEAAKQNTEMFINKERARLRIEMKPFRIAPRVGEAHTVDFIVSIHGPTPAFVVESACVTYVWTLEYMEYPEMGDRVMFPIHDLPTVVNPNSPRQELFAFMLLGAAESAHLLGEVKAGRMFVGIRGFIKYKDVFDRDRRTTFRYVWKYTTLYGMDPDYGNWEKCGTPEENQDT